MQSGQLPWWFGVPFLLAGLFAAAVGAVLLLDELRYGREGVAVTGVVVETTYFSGGEDGPSYGIRYEFVDPATGARHRGESDVSEQVYDAATAGDPVEVTYLPAEPTKSRIGSPEPQLLIPLIVIGAGGLLVVVGIGLLALTRWLRRNGVPAWVQVSGPAYRSHDTPVMSFSGGGGVDEDPAPAAAEPRTSPDELRALDARLAPPPASKHDPDASRDSPPDER